MPLSGAGHAATSVGGTSCMNVAWSSWLIVDRGLFRQSWWKLSARRVASPRQSTRLLPGQTVAALTDLVEALVLTECGAAARVDVDAVSSRHALRPLQMRALLRSNLG